MFHKMIRALAVLCVIAGACICMYPKASNLYATYQRNRIVEEFREHTENYRSLQKGVETYQEETGKKNVKTQEKVETQQEKLLVELLKKLQEYNQKISRENQKDLKDAFSYEDSVFDLAEYGLEDNMLATLWIPRMDVDLPVYLGATKENMKKGAVILGQTSMPLGGENTNTVIAAHRGGGATPMFRNIQLLQTGDKIEVTTPYDRLIYRVTEIKVIAPTDINEILIRQGQDMVTLITCHPYTKNTQRYLVRATRSMESVQSREQDRKEVKESGDNGEKALTVVEDELLDAAGIHYSETQIMLEKYGTLVGAAILLYAVISGVAERRKGRKER